MCNIDHQTSLLLTMPPIVPLVPPPFIMPLITAYVAAYSVHTLNLNVYPEPYYGDYNDCSAVLLTHNPGQSKIISKGIGSPFETAILRPPHPSEVNYYNLAVGNHFPNIQTVNWVNTKNNELTALLNPITTFRKRLFIRDLVPYHGQAFGALPMGLCADYLYNYFFCQVICSSLNSELYHFLNRKNPTNKTSILFARGSTWKDPQGLVSIGWDFIGRIYSNCYVFKANFNKIEKIRDVNINKWPCEISSHNIYIVVITPKKGGRVIIYKTTNHTTTDFNLAQIVINYDTINDSTNNLYIDHNKDLDEFISKLR